MPSVVTLALSANDPGLNAALTGVMRTITITNTGLYDTKGLTATVSPALPPGSSFATNCASVLPAGSSCQVTVAPGLTPTAAPLTASVPSTLRVAGENTNASITDIHILSYGSVYQAGYVFKLDDSTAPTASVGGKVLALSPESNGENWGPDGPTDSVPLGDGRATTQAIVNLFPGQPSAAKTCAGSSAGGFSDWYLPGVCEVHGHGCNGNSQPLIDTLFRPHPERFDTSISYWSADPGLRGNSPPFTTATSYQFYLSSSYIYLTTLRSTNLATRCMRDFSS